MTNKTIVLIRCMVFDERIKELYDQIRTTIPDFEVYAMPDHMRNDVPRDLSGFREAGIPVMPLNEEFLSSRSLVKAERRTGWVCGDYVIYRALDIDWDYAWVIEPDIYFLNGAEQILGELAQVNNDLIAAGIRKEGPGWHWYESLDRLNLGLEIHAMLFGIVRVSRELAEAAYELRRKISEIIEPEHRVPNDESVISSLAHSGDFTTLNIRNLFSEVFKYFSVMTRYNIEDILASENGRQIVHSGRTPENFNRYLMQEMERALQGNAVSKRRIINCLNGSSKESAISFIEFFLDENSIK